MVVDYGDWLDPFAPYESTRGNMIDQDDRVSSQILPLFDAVDVHCQNCMECSVFLMGNPTRIDHLDSGTDIGSSLFHPHCRRHRIRIRICLEQDCDVVVPLNEVLEPFTRRLIPPPPNYEQKGEHRETREKRDKWGRERLQPSRNPKSGGDVGITFDHRIRWASNTAPVNKPFLRDRITSPFIK